jgi:hypothetical protein
MHRLIAKFLLLFALVGNFAPLALAATAAPHACCVRKAHHHCHDSLASEQASEAGQLVIRDAACCNHECRRAVTTARWAHAQSPASASFMQTVEACLGQSTPVTPNREVSRLHSTRAPPAC